MASIALADYAVVENHGDASGFYVQDVLLTRNKDVTPHHLNARWSYVKAPPGTCPRFVVVDAKPRDIMSFSHQKCVRVIDLVLADGEGSLFRAVTSLTLSRMVSSQPPEPGMTLIVKEKHFILLDADPANFRAFMIIDQMALRFQPNNPPINEDLTTRGTLDMMSNYKKDNYTDNSDNTDGQISTDCYPKLTVEKVMREWQIQFMSLSELPLELHRRRLAFSAKPSLYREASIPLLENGRWGIERGEKHSRAWSDFYAEKRESREDWHENQEHIQLRNNNVEPCLCKTRHRLCACCTFFVPPNKLPQVELFATAQEHAHKALPLNASNFESLSHASQQVLCSWWYAVNIFAMFPRYPDLPICALSRIVCHHPSPNDQHILWMVTQQADVGDSLLAKCILDSIRMESEDNNANASRKRKVATANDY